MSKRNLIRSTGAIGVATAMSRVLGFIRDIVIARFFGTAMYAQAFVVAFRIPNLLRDLIGEGATNAAFVPVLTEELSQKGKEEFLRLAQVVLNILLVVLMALTLIGIAAAPLIVRLIAPGFADDPAKFHATVTLTRVIFPFLILVGLWAYAMGILNTLGYFAIPAYGPCALNLAMILCASFFGENVMGLAAGVLAGGVLQLLIQLPPLYKSGWRFRFTARFGHPQARKIGLLLIPRGLGACVYQVNVFISTILASLSSIVGEGAVAALYYANRVWQLPLAIFGIALAQAALPAMSRHVVANDMAKLRETVTFSLKILVFILVPSTIGLMALGGPITAVLFQRGAFTAYSTAITADALFYYAVGLAACGGIKILVSAFYAMRDTMTPLKTALASLIVNIALNLILMYPLKIGGLALATSISACFNFVILYIILEKRVGGFGTRQVLDMFGRVAASGLVMGAALALCVRALPVFTPSGLAGTIAAGIAVFFAASYALGVSELKDLIAWISRRR